MSAKIIQGEDRDITVKIKDGNGSDYDLTGATVLACFKKTDGTTLEVPTDGGSITIATPNECGKVTISLTDVETALLAVDSKDFEIEIDKGAQKRIVQLKGVLDVKERIC